MKKAADHCRQILNYVNQAVKEAENKQVKRKSKIYKIGLEGIKVVYLASEVAESITIQLIIRAWSEMHLTPEHLYICLLICSCLHTRCLRNTYCMPDVEHWVHETMELIF